MLKNIDNISKQEAIEIVFAATGDYTPFIATTALSIIENTNEQVNFHVLTDSFKKEDQIMLCDFLASFKNVSIDFIDVHEQLKIFENVPSYFSSCIVYARFLIPELFDFSKVLYLDIDIIVQCDIKELWNIDFYYQGKEYALAANKGASLTCNYEHYERFKKLNLSPDHLYFNSGILVINCDKWRKDNIFRELLKVAKKIKFKLIAADQDILNIYFDCNNYVHFSGSYNNAPDYNEVCANYNPKILHYASTKPWIECNTFKSENFWAVARRTPYYEQILYKFINKEWNNARKITITTEPKLFAAWVRSKSEEKNKL